MNKSFISRKLILTVLALIAVTAADLMGIPLDQGTLDAMTTMVQTLVGAQGAVDMAGAYSGGTAAADLIRSLKTLAPKAATWVDPDADPNEPLADYTVTRTPHEEKPGSHEVSAPRGGQGQA